MDAPHVSVFAREAIDALAIAPGGTYVDATFGAGGHTRAILARVGCGRVIALDADPSVARYLPADERVTLVHANFRTLASVLDELEIALTDGILFDLGVSSMQFDSGERGFSLRSDAPLDMRLDPTQGRSAAEYLEESTESEIADALFTYGDERASRRIARAIVMRRGERRLPATTGELAALVAGVLHRSGVRERIHPATRTFQALRIAVNDELGALRDGLAAAIERLRPGGRLAVISFHSLEDRIVKLAFRDDERVVVLTRKPLVPTGEEIASNPRARSAKLRIGERAA